MRVLQRVNRSVAEANDGTALVDYFNELEKLARKVFRHARMNPDPVSSRCAQIESEYEAPNVSHWTADQLAFYKETTGCAPLRRDQIDATLYCARKSCSNWVWPGGFSQHLRHRSDWLSSACILSECGSSSSIRSGTASTVARRRGRPEARQSSSVVPP